MSYGGDSTVKGTNDWIAALIIVFRLLNLIALFSRERPSDECSLGLSLRTFGLGSSCCVQKVCVNTRAG